MNWMNGRERRRRIVRQLRKEGEQAYLDGKRSCPYSLNDMDRYQWIRGYEEAELNDESAAKSGTEWGKLE